MLTSATNDFLVSKKYLSTTYKVKQMSYLDFLCFLVSLCAVFCLNVMT